MPFLVVIALFNVRLQEMASGPLLLGYSDEVDVGSCHSQAAGEEEVMLSIFYSLATKCSVYSCAC